MTDLTTCRVIDWDTAQIVPADSAVQHPLFIADVPGWINDGVAEDETFEDDRLYLEKAIERLHQGQPVVAAKLRRLLETSRERQFFELALRNKRINAEYVKRRLPQIHVQQSELQIALDRFLSHHKHMEGDDDMVTISHSLSQRKDLL